MQEISHTANPFPGLRPFESSETHLFFGRDGQSEELLRRLKRTRFLAVVGTSGSGKSSLVRAGLLPALQGGLMASAGSDWRIAILRPGGDPIGNLARALAGPAVLGSPGKDDTDMQAVMAETTLRRSSLGLVELVSRARTKLDDSGQPVFADYENLLVVVDQFEELFRFKQLIEEENSKEDAAAFVKLLLEAVGQKDEQKIYVVLTMRSDFLGDCSQFFELPEAINNGQYLIPRMTRDERREAISGPVAVGQGAISEPLVNQLLNDVGDNPDQLPILQHALMRTWDHWLTHRNGNPIDIPDYNAIGGMAQALSLHADEAYAELNDRQKSIAEKLFKGLTEKGTDNREIRRPMEVQEICELTGANEAAVIAVVEVFRREGRSFLMPPPADALTGAPVQLNRESLIDISHESLIRNWERLKKWVDEESRSARIYRRLAETAVLHKEGGAGLWRDPDLGVALTWREQSNPTPVWAKRYHPEFSLAMSFLDQSIAARDAQLADEEARRRKEIKRTRLTALIFGVAFLFSLLMAVTATYAFFDAKRAKDAATFALFDAKNAKDAAVKANFETAMALRQAKEDNEAARLANIKMQAAQKAAEDRERDAKEARKETEAALKQAKIKNEEAALANRSLTDQITSNLKAREANEKFREATALTQRGRFATAETVLKAAIDGYRDPYVHNNEAIADANVELAHNRYIVGYDYFIRSNADLSNEKGAKEDAEASRDYYDEAAKIYANPPVNAPEKAATTLFSAGMMLMKFTRPVDDLNAIRRASADSSGIGVLDEDLPELRILVPGKTERAFSAGATAEDPRVSFKLQAVDRFQRALELYQHAFDDYTKDTTKADDVREALLTSAREGMEKSAFQAGNYYRSQANELDAAGVPAQPDAAEKQLAKIREDNRQAASYFEKLLQLHPSVHDAFVANLLVWLGGLYHDLGDQPTAEKYFGRTVAAYAKARPNENKARVFASIAATLEEAGQVNPAIVFLERARLEHKIEGDLLGQGDTSFRLARILEGQFNRGLLTLSYAKYEEALAAYRQVPNKLEHRHFDTLFHMEEVWEKSGEYKPALEALQLITTIPNLSKADDARAYEEIGSLLALTGQTKEAIEAYQRAASQYEAMEPAEKRDAVTNISRVRRTIEGLKAALNQRPSPAAKGSN